MNSSNNQLGILTTRILPAIAALTIFATGAAKADSAGVTLINSKLATIPGLKVGTTVATAKSNDLLHALCLALDTLSPTATAAEIANVVEAALEKDAAGKVRKDKDKIAGQVIATAIANNNITDAATIAQITKEVFNVNVGDVKAALTAAGRGTALAGAIKAASPAAAEAIGAALGGSGAGEFTGAAADVGTLLSNTAKALSTSAPKAALSLESFTKGFLADELASDADRKSQAEAAAAAIAAKIPAAAGGILGGYVDTLAAPNNAALAALATSYVGNTKLAKALGDVLAYTMGGHSDQSALFTAISGAAKDKALVAQGLIRAGGISETADTMAALIASGADRVKSAAVVAAGNGNDEAKITAIVTALANGQDPVKAKPAIGTGVISAIGVLNPESADAAIKALIATGGYADAASRNALGVAIAPKVKTFSAVGYMAAGIAETNIGAATGATAQGIAVTTASAIFAKASKAGTDIVYRTAELSALSDKKAFAVALTNQNSKLATSAAVGASLADQANAADITASVINHAGAADKATIASAPKIVAAVATAVDEERAAEIVVSVGNLVSETGAVAGKPIKVAAFKTLATALGKAIQAKPNVTTSNRADELGEIAALLTNAIIQSYGGNTLTDAKKIAARDKAIIAAGSEILKVLSKKPVEESKTLLADQSAAEDIAGSIALTIHSALLPTAQRNSLLLAGGALEKTFLKYAGKKLLPDSNALLDSLNKVRNEISGFDNIFENGTKNSASDLQTIFNDKETDKRNG
jgi:hypothetical protein